MGHPLPSPSKEVGVLGRPAWCRKGKLRQTGGPEPALSSDSLPSIMVMVPFPGRLGGQVVKARPLARTNGHWLRFVKTKPQKHTAQVEPGASDRIRRKRILQGLCHVSSFLPAKAVSSTPREGLWQFLVTELGLLAFLYPSLPWSQKLLVRVLTAGTPSTLQGCWWGSESCEFAEQP